VAEHSPIPVEEVPEASADGLSLSDFSVVPKWRVFTGYEDVRPGTSKKLDEQLVWSVSPGEWTITGPRPDPEPAVELTHVRVMFRLTGEDARALLAKICALDLGDAMFPVGAAARTLVAGVATELVRDDQDGVLSYLILPSRSFGRYLHEVLMDAGAEFGLG
jgi:heterotetrameric sarcosine oxidase gamma subunit